MGSKREKICRAASWAALPFKSAPVEAAVADVLGILSVTVAVARTCSSPMPNSRATIWQILVCRPLPHLGAAMIDQHAAIGVNLYQSPGLIKMHDIKRYAEFYWREGDAFAQ